MPLAKIKKRNGEIVDFDRSRIEVAIKKAFDEIQAAYEPALLISIVDNVVGELSEKFFDKQLTVEDVQDVVEHMIVHKGFFRVARAYIIYRYEHTKIREKKKEEIVEKIEEGTLFVTKKNGSKERFDLEKIKKTLSRHTQGIENDIDSEMIIKQCQREVYDGITTEDVTRTLIMTMRSLIERDPAYSKITARLLLAKVYKDVFGADTDYSHLKEVTARVFIKHIESAVHHGLLDARMREFDLAKIASCFILENDDLFEYMGLEILVSRYLMEDPETKKTIETPQMFWMRIAMGTAIGERTEDRERVAREFYDVLSHFYYTPGGRTLFAAGTKKAQLSNCFLNVVPDSLEGIFKTHADNAQYLKWSGGTGTSWTPVRATGAAIEGTGVNSQGLIPFLKIANDVNVSINRLSLIHI